MHRLGLVLFAAAVPLAAQTDPAAVTIATHYFYWYDWPKEHFDQPGAPGPEGHCRHLADPERVSYRSADWHAQNFAAMAACGIDVALPVYWGAPGAYERPNLAFSRLGLPPMVEALDRAAKAGRRSVKLGLFYDTSTLANDVRGVPPAGGRADLSTDAGRALFCTTVTDFFAAIPRQHWATHRGGALVVLYVAAFAAAHDRTLGTALRTAFATRFAGERVCLVADASWGEIGQDLTTSWGAALHGPRLFAGVAQIGPGYDDRAVPGRRTPVREREDGAFYAASWRQVRAHRPELVLLETWNEMHEGTELCATVELGSRYEDATRAEVARFRAGEPPGEPIVLRWPEPRPQPDLSWGELAAAMREVGTDYARGSRSGLREVVCADGPCDVHDGALRAEAGAPGLGSYLYFQISDHFAFDVDAAFELVVARDPAAPTFVEFDSRDATATLQGAYTVARATRGERDGAWLVETFVLPHARFANRQNGGADFRLVLPERRGAVRSVALRPAAAAPR